MRGKDVDALGSVCRLGITPAYAGKRDGDDAVLACFWDHPRVCGEKGLLSYKIDQTQGSPPRMRGKVTFQLLCKAMFGITPAYAGKRHQRTLQKSLTRDHPRVCGEKVKPNLFVFFIWGSPPRMRGKAQLQGSGLWFRGITPAYAGKSKVFLLSGTEVGDHPRVCGEKTKKIP